MLERRITDLQPTRRQRILGWSKVLGYSVLTAVVTLSLATALGGASRDLARRVDENAALARDNAELARTASQTIICILRLGVARAAPPRTDANVQACADQYGFHLEDP